MKIKEKCPHSMKFYEKAMNKYENYVSLVKLIRKKCKLDIDKILKSDLQNQSASDNLLGTKNKIIRDQCRARFILCRTYFRLRKATLKKIKEMIDSGSKSKHKTQDYQ